jgi:hypothetical protein
MLALITTKNCPKCELVKKTVNMDNVRILDYDTPEAKAELAFRNLLGKPLSAPVLLFLDGDGYIPGDVNKIISEIKKYNESFK